VIDCNYFSSYIGLDEAVLAQKFDELFQSFQVPEKKLNLFPIVIGVCAVTLLTTILWRRR
jgi:hypothetical protein